jgi:hypothetical protein
MWTLIPAWLKWLGVALVVSVLLTVGVWLYGRYLYSATDRVAHSLNTMIAAVEHKMPALWLRHIAANYHDNFSRLNKLQLTTHARYWTVQHLTAEIDLVITDLQFQAAADDKTVTAEFTVSGNAPIQNVLNYFAFGESVRLRLHYREFSAGEWLIESAERLTLP